MTTLVWVDGSVVPADQARVSALDHGITVGDGVFETLRVYRSRPFALRRHLDRLARSAAGLGLVLPDRGVLEEAATSVVAAAGHPEARLRLTVTGGPGPLGSGRDASPPTVIAAVAPHEPFPPTTDVAVVPWARNERGALAGLKTTSYGENVVALAHAAERGAGEAVFANTRGELCEGTGSNVVVGRGGRLVTPPLSSGCLAGITRELVMELVDVEETRLSVDDLAGADEAFLTSSTRELQPIAHVDGRALRSAPGPLTSAAMSAFARLVAADPDP
ncbi:MAG: aminotransferase class IV [Acidimicrobiales bacterium]